MLKVKTIVCINCHREFEVFPYRLGIAKYCSRSCHYQAIRGRKGFSHSEETKIKIGKAVRKFYIENEELKRLYWEGNLSSINIADKFGTSSEVIKYWLKKYNIPRRTRSQARFGKFVGENHNNWKREKRKCLQCGIIYEVPPCFSNSQFCSRECWNEHGYSEESKKKMSNSQLKILEDPQQRQEYLHRILDNCNIRPNKVEATLDGILQKYFPDEWRYTGDFSVVIGGKSPDWTNCNGEKSVILLHGIYWHLWKQQKENPHLTKEQVETKDIQHYKDFGFDCLIIWENELKQPEKVLTKISKFYDTIKEV